MSCDPEWRTQRGEVRGWLGAHTVEILVTRQSEGRWTLNGRPVAGLEGCVDLDYGFTPATNLIQLRRARLAVGAAADLPAAWLDAPAGTLQVLPQRYERRGETTYWYESPTFGYAAVLEVTNDGFVQRYPGLWELEAP